MSQSREKRNGLDALRLGAAFLVMVSHGFALLGLEEHDFVFVLTGGAFNASWLGLGIFFAISGYLIDRSARREDSLRAFLRRRILRLWPGLLVVVLATIFVLGPALSSLSPMDHFRSAGTWAYLGCLTLWGMRWNVPGLFSGNPHHAVNGSLWTLPYEASFYLLSWFVLRKARGSLVPWGLFLGAIALRALAYPQMQEVAFRPLLLSVHHVLDFGLFYLAGTIVSRWTFPQRPLWGLLACLAVLWAFADAPTRLLIGFPAIALATLLLGLLPIPVLSRVGRFGDFSYGLYIWAFPVQQILVQLLGAELATPWRLAWVGALATLPLAILSWHLVEKPWLARKDRPLRIGPWRL